MTERDDLIEWLARLHERSAMSGWDFSSFGDRLDADEVPWDFDDEVRTALRSVARAADIGTGGGERLAAHLTAIGHPRATVVATEGWAENLPIARAALTPHGVEVLAYDPEMRERLPLDDVSQDLLVNRHEAVDAAEFARVLRPGGRLLTQQVDGRDAAQLREWFEVEGLYDHVTPDRMVAELVGEGFRIDDLAEWTGSMRFRDVGTLVEYLAAVPWDVPGFAPREHVEQLHRLAGLRPIEVDQRRFRIAATRV